MPKTYNCQMPIFKEKNCFFQKIIKGHHLVQGTMLMKKIQEFHKDHVVKDFVVMLNPGASKSPLKYI
jgi:hypothetical protein